MEDFGLTKSQVIKLSRLHSFAPRKKLGQNFLIDKNIIAKIIDAVSPQKEDVFLEVGAGLGALTLFLASKASCVVAFEIDRKLSAVLRERTRNIENIKIRQQDFLKADFADFSGFGKMRLIGNLPYYITSLIIEKLVENRKKFEDIHIMTQKEYAARLTAVAGAGKEYSSLTLFVNYFFLIEKLFLVKKSCFWPQPEVDSVFLRLKKRPQPAVEADNERLMFSIIRSSFAKRRKMVLNSLASDKKYGFKKDVWQLIFAKAGISAQVRAEELSLEDFARLADIANQLL